MKINILTDTYSVSFFGHRQIDDIRTIDNVLFPFLKDLISKKNYIVFYIGRNGEFDEYVASLIKRAQKGEPHLRGFSLF